MTAHAAQFSEGFAPDDRSRDAQFLARLDAILADLTQLREDAARAETPDETPEGGARPIPQ